MVSTFFLQYSKEHDLIYISIKYHEDILKVVDGRTAPCHNMTFFSQNEWQ